MEGEGGEHRAQDPRARPFLSRIQGLRRWWQLWGGVFPQEMTLELNIEKWKKVRGEEAAFAGQDPGLSCCVKSRK